MISLFSKRKAAKKSSESKRGGPQSSQVNKSGESSHHVDDLVEKPAVRYSKDVQVSRQSVSKTDSASSLNRPKDRSTSGLTISPSKISMIRSDRNSHHQTKTAAQSSKISIDYTNLKDNNTEDIPPRKLKPIKSRISKIKDSSVRPKDGDLPSDTTRHKSSSSAMRQSQSLMHIKRITSFSKRPSKQGDDLSTQNDSYLDGLIDHHVDETAVVKDTDIDIKRIDSEMKRTKTRSFSSTKNFQNRPLDRPRTFSMLGKKNMSSSERLSNPFSPFSESPKRHSESTILSPGSDSTISPSSPTKLMKIKSSQELIKLVETPEELPWDNSKLMSKITSRYTAKNSKHALPVRETVEKYNIAVAKNLMMTSKANDPRIKYIMETISAESRLTICQTEDPLYLGLETLPDPSRLIVGKKRRNRADGGRGSTSSTNSIMRNFHVSWKKEAVVLFVNNESLTAFEEREFPLDSGYKEKTWLKPIKA